MEQYHWNTPRDFDPAGYPEKKVSDSKFLQWISVEDTEVRPPKLQHILAWDGIRTGESWVSADGNFMRINATWERVFGTQVIRWARMPRPGEEE